jgi:hypothetical protein
MAIAVQFITDISLRDIKIKWNFPV